MAIGTTYSIYQLIVFWFDILHGHIIWAVLWYWYRFTFEWDESLWPLFNFVFLAPFSVLWLPDIWPKMAFPELFEKTIGSINFIPRIYPCGVSFLTPIHFRVPSLIFGPLVAKYLAENGVSGTFWKKTPKNQKTIVSIHFIPGIYPFGVSLLTPIHFCVPSLIFGPLVAKYLAENGVPGIEKQNKTKQNTTNYWFHSSHTWHLSLRGWIFIGYFWVRWVVIRAGVYRPHLWAHLVNLWRYFTASKAFNHYC